MSVTHSVHEMLTESAYVKSVRHNPNVLHHHQVVKKKCLMHSVYMFTIYLHTKFHMPSSKGSLVTAFKLKTKYRFQAANILFYCLQTKYNNKSCTLFKHLLP